MSFADNTQNDHPLWATTTIGQAVALIEQTIKELEAKGDELTSLGTFPTTMLLALVGSAVGIGNLVRFPYLAATYGGGTFILIYLLSTLFLATPMPVMTLAAMRATEPTPKVFTASWTWRPRELTYGLHHVH